MLRETVLAACLIIGGADMAWSACPGQTGKQIYSDDFTDDSGGWDIDAAESFVPAALQIKVNSKSKVAGALNLTFFAVNGDYCAVMAFPTQPRDADIDDYVALVVLASDYKNSYRLDLNTSGEAVIGHTDNGSFTVLARTNISAIKTTPGSENTLRIVVKDQKLTFSVNDTPIKTLRGQTPEGGKKFGFLAGVTGDNPPASERVYTVKSFSVTEAP